MANVNGKATLPTMQVEKRGATLYFSSENKPEYNIVYTPPNGCTGCCGFTDSCTDETKCKLVARLIGEKIRFDCRTHLEFWLEH